MATLKNTERASGDKMQFFDFRSRLRPRELWTDPEFAIHHAITDNSTLQQLKWKRPTELSQNPVLFSEGATRFDIGQGGAGTCYFLATVANISEKPELLKKVIPDDAYPVGTGDYKGVFHARFWNFGKWVDVYIDDYLPVIYDVKPWGASSAEDPNEFWVSLLEKAFAKFHGSYHSIDGGQAGDAFMALTGGVAEFIDFHRDPVQPNKLFERVRNALQTGALVTCSTPDTSNKVHGLVGSHAYSLTGSATAKGTNLLRIRNPWGNTEWKGPWADGSAEWNGVSEMEVPRAMIDDGEFWISLEDFLTYFSNTTICSLTPDFDMDGDSDALEYITNIYGEWLGKTAAGGKHKLNNPRYLFTVPESDSEVQVVVQLIQHTKERHERGFQVRCYLFKVLGDNRQSAVMEIMGENTNSYTYAIQCSYRHVVGPGTYAIVPSVREAGMEKSFLIRLFSSCPVTGVRQMPASYKIMATEQKTFVKHDRIYFPLTSCQTLYGAWSRRAGNDGGQVSYRESHANNPQYVFTIDKPNTMLALHVMQEQSWPQRAVGFKLYPGGNAPMGIDTIYSKYQSAVRDITGDNGKFVGGVWNVKANYLLNPGQYTLLLHLNDPGEEKNFALVVKSSAPVGVMGHQTGM